MTTIIFWFFLIVLIIATLQDLKRREVDNWLNLTLILFSLAYIIFNKDNYYVLLAGITFFIMYLLSNLLYYGRVFAGGDAKLLFAMSLLFIGNTLQETTYHLLLFIFLLMISGSLYGIIYSLTLYFKHRKEVNKKMAQQPLTTLHKLSLLIGILSLILSYFILWLLFPAIILTGLPFLLRFARSLEDITMNKTITGKQLREGDWLTKDITIKGKTIKANWEGITKKELAQLQHLKKITIKEGMPFVPAFLIAYLLYTILQEQLINLLSTII